MAGIDLFKPVVRPAEYHPHFHAILNLYPEEDRDVLRDWAAGFEDRDGKFVREFQTTFNSGFWELYLFAALKALDLKVDFRFNVPDFVITNFWNKFCVEATTAQNAKGKIAEWEGSIQHTLHPNIKGILQEATIRLANALTAKYQKYQDSYRKLSHVKNQPFLIAIAPYEQPAFRFQNDHAVRRVVYGYDEPVTVPKSDGSLHVLSHKMMPSIEKSTGVNVQLGFFREGKMNEVSAVIFSNTATYGKVRAMSKASNPHVIFETTRFDANSQRPTHTIKPKADYTEDILDGLVVLHNPCANFPLELKIFAKRGVTQYVWPLGDRLPTVYSYHGNLLQRTVITLESKCETTSEVSKWSNPG